MLRSQQANSDDFALQAGQTEPKYMSIFQQRARDQAYQVTMHNTRWQLEQTLWFLLGKPKQQPSQHAASLDSDQSNEQQSSQE